MTDLADIAEIERKYRGPGGQPSLGEAYGLLLKRWHDGSRDRETSLRLLFLAWFALAEPTWYTGLPDDAGPPKVFRELFYALGGPESTDTEFLAVAAYMIEFAPFYFGDEKEWLALADRCSRRAPRLGFELEPAQFRDRGSYGDYFERAANFRLRFPAT